MIQNNTSFITKTVSTAIPPVKPKTSSSNVNEVYKATAQLSKNGPSLALTSKEEESVKNTLGYDKPTKKQKNSVDLYQQTAIFAERDNLIESLGFHFIV